MGAVVDRVAAAAKQVQDVLDGLATDAAKAEADITTQANAAAQQTVATYSANSQDLIASIKVQYEAQLTLLRKEMQAEKQAALDAQQAAFNAQIAALKKGS